MLNTNTSSNKKEIYEHDVTITAMFAELPNELELAVSYQSSKSSYLEACYQFDVVVVVDVVAKIKKT